MDENNQYNVLAISGPNIARYENDIDSIYNTTALIELASNEIDTIHCTYKEGENFLICIKILYNGEQVWESADLKSSYFTIIK
jgi:hypothetical protein